jgi:hypothetical protein
MQPYHEPPFLRARPPGRSEDPLSLAALVQNGTLDLDLAALLWLTVAHRGSIVVAAAPRLAGKTTLLSAVTDLVAEGTEVVYTQGEAEDFAFLGETHPHTTLIVVNEVSDHLPIYLWGSRVTRVFEALRLGYSVAATLHADSAEETLDVLLDADGAMTPDLVGGLAIIANLTVVGEGADVTRRVAAVHVVLPTAAGRPGLGLLAEWEPWSDTFRHAGPEVRAGLARRLGMEAGAMEEGLSRRRAALDALRGRGPMDREEARRRLADLS